jgi:hypothetical protein
LSLIFLTTQTRVQADQLLPWEQKYIQLLEQRDILFIRLEEVHTTLVARVQNEAPSLLPRLSLTPPRTRNAGYGLLPEVRNNAAQVTVVPKQTFYSLKWLEGRLEEEIQQAEKLAEQVPDTIELEPLITSFEQSLKQFRNLENNLNYHQLWQKEVIRSAAYFNKKNELVALARQMNTLILKNESPQQVTELRVQLVQSVASFKPTAGLKIISLTTGRRVLPVTVCTDIENQDFLQAFYDGVQDAFSNSPAAKAQKFSVNLKWQVIGADVLYPEGAPVPGAKIDLREHRRLFKECPLVLTTGAPSTNAMIGNRIFLGTEPVSRRTLAHEFGHLLGFEDAYLRGYDGKHGGPYGVIMVEWIGLTPDLMGDSEVGQVSPDMIDTLISVYGTPVSE